MENPLQSGVATCCSRAYVGLPFQKQCWQPGSLYRDPWLCVPASRRVCPSYMKYYSSSNTQMSNVIRKLSLSFGLFKNENPRMLQASEGLRMIFRRDQEESRMTAK